MITSPVSLSRRHVLGDLYSRCDMISSIPVYLNSLEGEVLGYADQSMGHYADAFSFHVAEDVCKKLSSGYFTYAFDYDYSQDTAVPGRPRRVTLNSICLIARQNYERPATRPARSVG